MTSPAMSTLGRRTRASPVSTAASMARLARNIDKPRLARTRVAEMVSILAERAQMLSCSTASAAACYRSGWGSQGKRHCASRRWRMLWRVRTGRTSSIPIGAASSRALPSPARSPTLQPASLPQGRLTLAPIFRGPCKHVLYFDLRKHGKRVGCPSLVSPSRYRLLSWYQDAAPHSRKRPIDVAGTAIRRRVGPSLSDVPRGQGFWVDPRLCSQ